MKQFLSLLFIILSISVYSQQDITINWSKDESNIITSSQIIAAKEYSGSLVLVTYYDSKATIKVIDQNLNLLKEKVYPLERKEVPIEFFMFKNNLILINELKTKKNSALRFYTLDLNNINYMRRTQEIPITDKKIDNTLPHSVFSPDKQWFCHFRKTKNKKDEHFSFTTIVYHSEHGGKKIEQSLKYSDKEFSVLDVQINNNGEVLILGNQAKENTNQLQLLSIIGPEIEALPLVEVKQKYSFPYASLKIENEAIFVGAISFSKPFIKHRGLFFFEITDDLQINHSITNYNLSEEVDLESSSLFSNESLRFIDIIKDKNGGYYLLSEQVSNTDTYNPNFNNGFYSSPSSGEVFTSFGDAIITYVKNGKVENNFIIRKSYNNIIGSFPYSSQFIVLEKTHYLLYTTKTDKEQLSQANIETKSLRNIGMFLLPIGNGTLGKELLLSGGKEKVTLPLPGSIYQINESAVLLIGRKPQGSVEKLLIGERRIGKASIGKIQLN